MKIKLKDSHQFILLFDTEYDEGSLVQFAGILLKKTDAEHYELHRTTSVFVAQKLSKYFIRYTNMTQDYINKVGVSLEKAKEEVLDKFFCNVNTNSLLIASHGVQNDLKILHDNGITFNGNDWDYFKLDSYCTYNAIRRVPDRTSRFKLDDVAKDGNFVNAVPHNAFVDAWATLAAFCYLKEREEKC